MLADEPVRVLASTNRRLPAELSPLPTPANAVVVDWLSYSQAMGAADLVICHGGHGTVARALTAGVPVLCCPAVGDMAENGARVAWSGAGLMLPWRLLGRRTLRLAVRRRSATALRLVRAISGPGRGPTTGPSAGRRWSRRSLAGGRAATTLTESSGGGTRTHTRRP